ncbi:rhodanese-like domain-containing protein [Streptomyces sp. NPDC088801]|uniref:rhodanese-like domain-containing protein n=1 Tax=Streptomyces sp. NPDC088801 TaxID=3365903 RepID=UPI003803C3CE
MPPRLCRSLTGLAGIQDRLRAPRRPPHLGKDTWLADGNAQATTAFLTADRATGRPYVDVWQEAEFAAGHVPGAVHLELGALNESAADAPTGPVVACGHGERAMTAASLLERAGHTDIAVLDGGPDDYTAAHGQQLAQGTEAVIRYGKDGIYRVRPPGGLVAARFRHYESRSGRPLLHDHLLLSVKGQLLDGKWGSCRSAFPISFSHERWPPCVP